MLYYIMKNNTKFKTKLMLDKDIQEAVLQDLSNLPLINKVIRRARAVMSVDPKRAQSLTQDRD